MASGDKSLRLNVILFGYLPGEGTTEAIDREQI